MSYFDERYSSLSYPIVTDESPGLRNAQLGGIHAVSAHFTIRKEPALVVLPTGAGKTAVLMMLPFVRRRERVLIGFATSENACSTSFVYSVRCVLDVLAIDG